MYPFISIGDQIIEMTGLGAIIGILVFCLINWIYARQMKLTFQDFFYALPTFLLIVYGLGAYFGFVANSGHLLPYSIMEVGQIIMPPGFGFHAGGLAIGMLMSIIIFIYKQPAKNTRKPWIDCLSISYMLGIVIFGIFLTLGDHMIGLPAAADHWLSVYALTPFSEVSKFTAVYPVGLFVSIVALLSYILSLIWFKKQVVSGRGWGTLSVFFLGLGIALLFQNYPRHGVLSIAGLRMDINQYILILLSILCCLAYIYNYKKSKQFSELPATE